MRAWGIASWLFALLTVVNLFACPRYRDSATAAIRSESGMSVSYEHVDAAWFAGVEVVVLATLAGACLLRHELRRLGGALIGEPTNP